MRESAIHPPPPFELHGGPLIRLYREYHHCPGVSKGRDIHGHTFQLIRIAFRSLFIQLLLKVNPEGFQRKATYINNIKLGSVGQRDIRGKLTHQEKAHEPLLDQA